MALNDVTFVKGKGGLGRPLAGEDHISALLFYSNTLPSGFASNDRIKKVFSLEEAEELGITNDHTGETTATGTITVTGAGVENDTILIKVDEGDEIVTLGTATVPSAPTTSSVATSIRDAINEGRSTHGYTATANTATVSVVAPDGRGVGANSYTWDITINGTATNTDVDFTGGVASPIDVIWYHVSEFFRINEKGELYIGIYAVPSPVTFSEISTMQVYAEGKIRQLGVYVNSTSFATSQTTTIQGVIDDLFEEHMPLQVIYAPDISGTVDLSTLSDLRALSNGNVSVVIGQDGGATGDELFTATGKSISCLGALLGAVSKAKVNENIGWIAQFNMADDELDTVAFSNGNLYRSISSGLVSSLNDSGYVFLRKHIGIDGSYFNDSHTCISESEDYAYIENNRTIDKATRDVRTNVLPALNSPLLVNTDGTLAEDTIAYFKSLAEKPLETMQNNAEVSQFQVTINPAQDVLSTSQLIIAVKIVPVGVARQIKINIGFTVRI